MQDIRQKLAEVFQVVFDLSPDVDPILVSQKSLDAWDSLGHVTLVTAMESEFEIEITAVDSIELTSFGSAETLVIERLGNSGGQSVT